MKARKPKKKQPQETYQTYIFKILDWTPQYHLSINHDTREESLYWEHASVHIETECVFPKKLAAKSTKFFIVGDRTLLDPPIRRYEKQWRPRSIGGIIGNNGNLEFYGSIPYDALAGVVGMLAAHRWSFALLVGSAMRYRKSSVRSMYFESQVNLDDY